MATFQLDLLKTYQVNKHDEPADKLNVFIEYDCICSPNDMKFCCVRVVKLSPVSNVLNRRY